MVPWGSREHLVQYWSTCHHVTGHLCLQHGVRYLLKKRPGKEKLGVLNLTISADLDGLICFLKNFQSCKTSFQVPSRDITWPYNLLNKKKIHNLISERLRPPPRQNSYDKEPKKWPSLITSVTHSFMQRSTNPKSRTVSSWLQIGLNLY